MTEIIQQLANGITKGSFYALIALGYTMVYGIIQLINFAHGEVVMIGAMVAFSVINLLVPTGLPPLVIVLIGTGCAVPFCMLIGYGMERLAYRPLRNAPRLAPLITAIGVSIVLQEAVRVFYPGGKSPLSFPRLISGPNVELGGVTIARVSIFLVVVAVVLMVGLQAFVRTSRTGKAMRATAQDPDTARLMGIDTDRIIVITFVIGAALAAVAGVLQGMRFVAVDFRIGFLAGLKAFTAAVLGGIGNITGAMLGGFVLGVVEALATQYLPLGSGYKDVWAFAVLIAVLVFRPAGLLGEQVGGRG